MLAPLRGYLTSGVGHQGTFLGCWTCFKLHLSYSYGSGERCKNSLIVPISYVHLTEHNISQIKRN